MKKRSLALFGLIIMSAMAVNAQSGNYAEDRLQNDTTTFLGRTTIGGYGNAFYQRNFNLKTSTVDLERFVLFTGHKFSNRISFFSELEVEDAKVVGGETGGEISVEQAYLRFSFNPTHYLVAGLFLPRIGILNEDHLPNSFNGNERTQVETFILPSTWRELGVGFYGTAGASPISYSVGLVNGLNSAGFEHGSGIRDGRFEGRNASANCLALTGSLLFGKENFKAKVSGYYGGSVGISPRKADSLQLTSGFFGTPVAIGEADVQYEVKGFSARALAAVVSIPNAYDINRAYANNTPDLEYGAYAEVAYNIFETMPHVGRQQLIAFARYETLDINASIPANGIIDGTLRQQHVIVGFGYLPIPNVVVKADVRILQTGDQNPKLIINPNPVALPYKDRNTFLNIGLGYSF